MSCLWKLSRSTPPGPTKTAESGSVLDSLKCVGHSAFQQQGDAKKNASDEGTTLQRKGEQVKGNLKRPVNFKSFTKINTTFKMSVDTRSPSQPRQALSYIRSTGASQRSAAQWGLYCSGSVRIPSTVSHDSYGNRSRAQTKREATDYRRQERQRKSYSRSGRNSLKPVFPVLFEGPTISQCEGITPVSAQLSKSLVPQCEPKTRTPVFRQHYEIMFQDAPWTPLKSSANLRSLTASSRGTCKRSRGSCLGTFTSMPSSCCTPDSLHLDGLRLHGTCRAKTSDTASSGRGGKRELQELADAEKYSRAADDGKSESDRTAWDTGSSDLVTPSESIDSTRWDPSQFKVTVTKTKR